MATDPPASPSITGSAQSAPTALDPAAGHVVLINTYEVDPTRAEDLLAFLVRSTHSTLKRVPGFLSANLHVSHDRTRIVNYAQWTNLQAIAAARATPDVAALMGRQLELARSFTPVPYELRASIGAGDAA